MNWLYEFARGCALIPTFIGGTAIIVWLLGQNEGLMQPVAITVLFLGLGLLPLGLLAISGYYWKSPNPRQQVKSNTLKAMRLFLVAGVITAAVLSIACRYTVEIQNAMHRPLNDVHILGAGVDVVIGEIQPGETVSRSFFIRHDGVLRIEAVNGEHSYSQEISGYVNKLHGERYGKVKISPSELVQRIR